MRYDASALERLRAKVAGAENGWFFAQIAERVAERPRDPELESRAGGIGRGDNDPVGKHRRTRRRVGA